MKKMDMTRFIKYCELSTVKHCAIIHGDEVRRKDVSFKRELYEVFSKQLNKKNNVKCF
jgi:hypothetical protein